jgi:hypothetical protein
MLSTKLRQAAFWQKSIFLGGECVEPQLLRIAQSALEGVLASKEILTWGVCLLLSVPSVVMNLQQRVRDRSIHRNILKVL